MAAVGSANKKQKTFACSGESEYGENDDIPPEG